MKNNTLIKIAIAVVVAGLFIFSIYLAVNNSGKSTVTGSGDKISVKTPVGQVQTKNFLQNFVEQSGDALVLAKTQDYDIVYYKQDQVFYITLLSQPLSKAMDAAEKTFVEKLGVDVGQACQLKVVVRVPFSVDSGASGVDYGLSFCPNSKKLEFGKK